VVAARDSPREPPCARVPGELNLYQSGGEAVDRAERDAENQVVSGVRAAACADQARCGRGGGGALPFDDERDLSVLGRQTATPGAVSRGDGLALIAVERRARPARSGARLGLGSIRE
jgi:hypothetical protein